MKNMSFMLTTRQVREQTKTVTRRSGWLNLKAGDRLCAVKKGMGLKKGEKIEQLATIEVVSVRRELLSDMLDNPTYGRDECVKEGFGDHAQLCEPEAFVRFFCKTHQGCTPQSFVTRIEFSYLSTPTASTKQQGIAPLVRQSQLELL